MTLKLDHIAIAVENLDKGLAFYRDTLGIEHAHTEEVVEQKVEAAMLKVGSAIIELVAPTSDMSPVAKYIARKGEGLHHLAFQVENIEEAIESIRNDGGRLIDDTPRAGAMGTKIAFVHPSSAAGVLVELVQKPLK